MAEKLLEAGVGTIERLGTMTPEELEEIPGIDPASVEFIQAAVVAYYSQFEDPVAEAGAEGSVEAEAAEGELEQPAGEVAEEPLEADSGVAETVSGEVPETAEQFGTIEDAGSPHNHAEGAGAESVPEKSNDE